MVQIKRCAEEQPCRWTWRCDPGHKQVVDYEPKKLSLKLGPLHAAMNRIASTKRRHNNETGEAEIFVVDTSMLKPLYSHDEIAAYKIGGLDAMQKIVKAKAAEQRKQERALQKALKGNGMP